MPTYDPDTEPPSEQIWPDDERPKTLPFGKYKGWPLTAVPETDYLTWMWDKAQKDWLRKAIQEELERRADGGLLDPPPDAADVRPRRSPVGGWQQEAPAPPVKPTGSHLPPLEGPALEVCRRLIDAGELVLLERAREAIEEGQAPADAEAVVRKAARELSRTLATRARVPNEGVDYGRQATDTTPF